MQRKSLFFLLNVCFTISLFQVSYAQISGLSGTPDGSGDILVGWTDGGTPVVADFWVFIGNAPGRRNFANSGALGITSSYDTFGTAFEGNIPVNGTSTIYIRLWYLVGTNWSFIDTSVISVSGSLPPDPMPPVEPEIDTPAPFCSTSVTLSWGTIMPFPAVDEYWIFAGNAPGRRNSFNSGST